VYDEVTDAAMIPAPAPPVIQESKDWGNVGPAPGPHFPRTDRGSVGIQPSRRPSWYDHKGDSTIPAVELLIY